MVSGGVFVIVFHLIVVTNIDNFLRPILLSGRTQMNGLLVFISLLGGISAFGLIGLASIGPILAVMLLGVIF